MPIDKNENSHLYGGCFHFSLRILQLNFIDILLRKRFSEGLGQKLLVSRQTISLWEKDQTVPTIDNLIS